MTLAELHEVIQTAIGWTNTHLHEFEIDGVSYGDPDPDWESEFADESKGQVVSGGARGRPDSLRV
jgi:hypothetical protein